MSALAVETILRKIESLNSRDRLALEKKLATQFEAKWKKSVVLLRKQAARKQVDEAAIEAAIHRHRYGK